MSTKILSILLLAALCHALWNALARKVSERDEFFTLILGVSTILYLPLAFYLGKIFTIPPEAYLWIGLSIIFDCLYLLSLAKAYSVTSLTSAYPIIRGTTPIATTLLSFLLFGMTIKILGLIGICLIVPGVLFINQKKFSLTELRTLFSQGFEKMKWVYLTGIISAMGHIIDGQGALSMSGILFKYLVFIGVFIGKWAIDRKKRRQVAYLGLFRRYPLATILGAILLFATNALTTYTMQTTPVTYVVAVREISIVFATLIGIIWLKEKVGLIKWVSIGLILAGVISIKLS